MMFSYMIRWILVVHCNSSALLRTNRKYISRFCAWEGHLQENLRGKQDSNERVRIMLSIACLGMVLSHMFMKEVVKFLLLRHLVKLLTCSARKHEWRLLLFLHSQKSNMQNASTKVFSSL